MSVRRILAFVAFAIGGVLFVPPAVVWAKQAAIATEADERGRFAAATQLYDAWQRRLTYRNEGGGHPTLFPYLDCDASLPGRLRKIDQALTSIWIRDHASRLRIAYITHLSGELTVVQATGLTACIEASVLAEQCSASVRKLTYGRKDQIDMSAEDRRAANAYCRSVKAILYQVSAA